MACVLNCSCVLKVFFFQVDFFLELHGNDAQNLAQCEYANRKAKKIARPELKKILENKLLILKRYRISKQDPSHISNSSFVLEATDTHIETNKDGVTGHRKVALKFFESKFEFDLEKNARDEINSYHRNQAIISSDIISEEEGISDRYAALQLPSPVNTMLVDQLSVCEGAKQADNSPPHLIGHLMKNARTGVFKGNNWTEHCFELVGLKLHRKRENKGKLNKVILDFELEQGILCHPVPREVAVNERYIFAFNILDSRKKILIELAAKTQDERDRWIQGINNACQVRAFVLKFLIGQSFQSH
jgi:hypothetical protein